MNALIMSGLTRTIGHRSLAVVICAAGRGLDFATTWVGIGGNRAVESQLLASLFIHLMGTGLGLIAYEFLITTPLIFLGCRIANKIQASKRQSQLRRSPLSYSWLYAIGTLSTIIAIHNMQFLY